MVQWYPVPQAIPDGDRECPFTPLSQLPGVHCTTLTPITMQPSDEQNFVTVKPLPGKIFEKSADEDLFLVPADFLLAYEHEAMEPTPVDTAELQEHPMILHFPSEQPLKFKKRSKKNSPRSQVQVDLKEIDHTICGPPCKTVEVPEQILSLNLEF